MRREIRVTERAPRGRNSQITAATGTMDTGKSALLVAETLRFQAAFGLEEEKIQIFSFPVHATILSGPVSVKAVLVRTAEEIRRNLRPGISLMVIEEAQLIGVDTPGWKTELLELILELAEKGVHCLVGGLLTTFEDEEFGSMPALAKIADRLIETRAECLICHRRIATCNFRRQSPRRNGRSLEGEPIEDVDKGHYIRVCGQCHTELAPDCHKDLSA